MQQSGDAVVCSSARTTSSQRLLKPSRRWVLSVALGSLSILSSCGGGTSSPAPATPGPVSLQSISVAPTSVTVAAGLTQQYSATGKLFGWLVESGQRHLVNIECCVGNHQLYRPSECYQGRQRDGFCPVRHDYRQHDAHRRAAESGVACSFAAKPRNSDRPHAAVRRHRQFQRWKQPGHDERRRVEFDNCGHRDHQQHRAGYGNCGRDHDDPSDIERHQRQHAAYRQPFAVGLDYGGSAKSHDFDRTDSAVCGHRQFQRWKH